MKSKVEFIYLTKVILNMANGTVLLWFVFSITLFCFTECAPTSVYGLHGSGLGPSGQYWSSPGLWESNPSWNSGSSWSSPLIILGSGSSKQPSSSGTNTGSEIHLQSDSTGYIAINTNHPSTNQLNSGIYINQPSSYGTNAGSVIHLQSDSTGYIAINTNNLNTNQLNSGIYINQPSSYGTNTGSVIHLQSDTTGYIAINTNHLNTNQLNSGINNFTQLNNDPHIYENNHYHDRHENNADTSLNGNNPAQDSIICTMNIKEERTKVVKIPCDIVSTLIEPVKSTTPKQITECKTNTPTIDIRMGVDVGTDDTASAADLTTDNSACTSTADATDLIETSNMKCTVETRVEGRITSNPVDCNVWFQYSQTLHSSKTT